MAPNNNFVNIADLNKVLRSEVFVSEDRQLRVVHLILDFQPLSDKFQDVGHAIRIGDPWLAWIDISVPRFLAQEYIVPVELTSRHFPCKAVVLREELASSWLSHEAEIDQFRLEEEEEEQEKHVIQVLDSEGELDKSSVVRNPKFIVARVDDSSKEEEEMALNKKKGLRELFADRAKGQAPKDISGS